MDLARASSGGAAGLALFAALALAMPGGLSRAPTAEALSCAQEIPPPPPGQDFEDADVVLRGVALSGPGAPLALFTPARFLVARYLKGSGPRVVRVRTDVTEQLGGGASIIGGGFAPTPGKAYRLFIDLPGRRSRVRSREVVSDEPCGGPMRERSPLRRVRGSLRSAVAPAGGSRWRAGVLRGPRGLRCVGYRRQDLRASPRRACERTAGRRSSLLLVDSGRSGGARAGTLVAASGPRLTALEVRSVDGIRAVQAAGRGRLAVMAFAGHLHESELTITLRFADGSSRTSRGDAARRARAPDPGGDAPWTAVMRPGARCVDFRQASPRFAAPARIYSGGGACGSLKGDGLFFGVKSSFELGLTRPPPEPPRNVLVGAVGPRVAALTVRGPGGAGSPAPAARGRAFLAVFPGTVTHRQLTLEVRYTDGSVAVFRGRAAVD